MTKLIDSLKARKAAASEGGFSLIDVVVTVAIIVALSIGGFIAYTGLVDSAKDAAVAGAADQLRTAATVAINDEDPLTLVELPASPAANQRGVIDDFNSTADGLTASYDSSANTITVTHDDDSSKTKTVQLG